MSAHNHTVRSHQRVSTARKSTQAVWHYIREYIFKEWYFYGIFVVVTFLEILASHAIDVASVRLFYLTGLRGHIADLYGPVLVMWIACTLGGPVLAIWPLRTTPYGKRFRDPLIGGSAWLYHRWGWIGFFLGSGICAAMGMAEIVKADGHPRPVRMTFLASMCFATIWIPGYTLAGPTVWHYAWIGIQYCWVQLSHLL
jgi:hypothetical protein